MNFTIKKSSGEIENFDEKKLRRSLIRPGASPEIADKIISFIKKNISKFKSTEDIYRLALDRLIEENPPVAARYNLKKAIFEFGPTGFPFEKFIAQILQFKGYNTKLNQIIPGWCVNHEIDILIKNKKEVAVVECKFHNEPIFKTNVRVPLYTQARFEDIKKTINHSSKLIKLDYSWVFTNTKFTYESIKYSNCAGIKLTSWDYPKDENLARLIEQSGLHPITCLTSLNKRQKKYLIDQGLVYCKDSSKFEHELKKIHVNYIKVIDEAEKTCNLKS